MFRCREAPTTSVVGLWLSECLHAFCNFHPFCIESFWYFHIVFTCFYWFSGSRAIYVPIQMVCEPLLGHSFCPFGFQCFLAMWWEASMGKRALESALDLAEVERHAQDFAEKHPYWKLVAKMEGHRDRMTSCIWPMSFVLFVGWFFWELVHLGCILGGEIYPGFALSATISGRCQRTVDHCSCVPPRVTWSISQ